MADSMNTTRRDFLRVIPGAGAAVLVPTSVQASEPSAPDVAALMIPEELANLIRAARRYNEAMRLMDILHREECKAISEGHYCVNDLPGIPPFMKVDQEYSLSKSDLFRSACNFARSENADRTEGDDMVEYHVPIGPRGMKV